MGIMGIMDIMGIPAQTETSTLKSKYLTRRRKNDKPPGVARTPTFIGTSARGIPANTEYVLRGSWENLRPFF